MRAIRILFGLGCFFVALVLFVFALASWNQTRWFSLPEWEARAIAAIITTSSLMCMAASLFLLLAHRVSLSRQISLGIVTIFSLTIALAYYLGAHGMTALEQAYKARVNADLAFLAGQLDLHRACTGSYPATEQGLDALIERPPKLPIPSGWRQLLVSVPKDPWDTPYQYRCPGTHSGSAYDLFSAGPDQRNDTRDDIYQE